MFDGYTIVFEIINFLILVVLLKKFLFKRIIAAMDKREADIVARLEAARKCEAEAKAKGKAYAGKLAEFEAERNNELAAVQEEVARQQKDLMAKARKEVEARRADWQQELADERVHFLNQLSLKIGEQLRGALKAALTDLADAELQPQVVSRFCGSLAKVTEKDLAPVKELLKDGKTPKLFSAFKLESKQAKEVTTAVSKLLDTEPDDGIEIDKTLVCGIECRIGGISLGWSAASWLDTLSREVDDALDRQSAEQEDVAESESAD